MAGSTRNRGGSSSRRLDDSVERLSRPTSRTRGASRSSASSSRKARSATTTVPKSDWQSDARAYSASRQKNAGATHSKSSDAPRQKNSRGSARSSGTDGSASARRRRPSARDGAKVPFRRRHPRAFAAIVVACALVAIVCVVDVAASWGRVHPGVTVCGVEVGGLSRDAAADLIEEELSDRAEAASVTIVEADGDAEAWEGADEDGSAATAEASEVDEFVDEADTDDADSDDGTSKDFASSAGNDANDDGDVSVWEVDADTLGLGIDAEAAAEEAFAVGRKADFLPARIRAWMGSVDVAAQITVKKRALRELTAEIDDSIGTKVVNSKIAVESGEATVKEGSDGWLVDDDVLLERLSVAFFDEEVSWVATPMSDVAMYISPETASSVADVVNDAIAESVEVTYKKESLTLDTADLGEVIAQKVMQPGHILEIADGTQNVVDGSAEEAAFDMSAGTDADSGWVLQAYADQEALDDILVDFLGDDADGNATDASFDVSSGKVVIVPSKKGRGPDRASACLDIQELLFGDDASASRIVEIENAVIRPSFTTADAKAMGITDKLASWSIAMSGTSSRQHNIILLAELINGSITAPGETWSFNETTGERTAEKGFEEAGAYVEGEHVDQVGGGICQVATCVFNAACFSGLGIGTRSNHTYYVSAYDESGFNDATVSWETPDLQWINDTDNYILLTASAAVGGSVTVTLWGTDDGREVTCERGKWKKGEKYETVYEDDDTLEEGVTKVTSEGVDGRKITIHYYVVSAKGKVLHDIDFHSVYAAEDEVIAVGTKKVKASETESSSKSSSKNSAKSSSKKSTSGTDDATDEDDG